MDLRIAFLGTPDFAIPTLRKLAEHHLVVGVVSQPDRPAGRGRKMVSTPVKRVAEDLGLEIHQPVDVNTSSSLNLIQDWEIDLICVAAFGQILKPPLLSLPKGGCLNVHASLLPRWRGASPINAAILAGDSESGVTIMKMGPGLDDGPILSQESVPIGLKETAGTLSSKLSVLGGELLLKTIPPYIRGEIIPQPQDPKLATYAKMLKKKSGEMDFNQSAADLSRKVRAYSPWPGAFTTWNGKRLLIHQTSHHSVTSPGPGVLLRHRGQPAIGTSEGILVLEKLQLAGKKPVSGEEFLNGTPSWGLDNK
jgi:methionyl-tRNA formyltransferase